ncbi:MAG TPA: CoA transferase, partial [Pseudonocardiaceae bacterium]|nr:CoA transferase [Pseudonocardiaceae bacterium]
AICAQGVLAGLLTRANTGRGQRVDSSLLGAAGVLLRRYGSPAAPAPHAPVPPSLVPRYPMPTVPAPSAPGPDTAPLNVPVCTDLAALAADPRFALALRRGAPTFPRPPWEFG